MSLSSVKHIKSVIPGSEISQALDLLSTREWREGFTHDDEYRDKVKRNKELRRSDCITIAAILDKFQKMLWNNTEFVTTAFPYKHAALRFNKCSDGGFYGPHADASIMNKPPIRSDLSMTLWLTKDYEGGELVINGEKYKGEPGDIIVYPSYYVHEVTPVTEGERICAVMWIQSMVREHEKREMLTRFYQYGQRLKDKEHLSADYIEISSLYNNLLRMWAEV